MKKCLDDLEHKLCISVLCLLPLHLCLSFLNLANGIDAGYGHSYPWYSYALVALYLLVLLSVDAFTVRCRTFGLSNGLRRYWGISCLSLVLALISAYVFHSDGLALLGFFISPFLVLAPLLELLDSPVGMISIAVVGAFCVLNWAIFKYFPND